MAIFEGYYTHSSFMLIIGKNSNGNIKTMEFPTEEEAFEWFEENMASNDN